MNVLLAVLLLSLSPVPLEAKTPEPKLSKEAKKHARFLVMLQQARFHMGVTEAVTAEPLPFDHLPHEHIARLEELIGKKNMGKWRPNAAYVTGSRRTGWIVYYNPAWLRKVRDGAMFWTALHEVAHVALDAERTERGAHTLDEWMEMEELAVDTANQWVDTLMIAP